ncbi:MAG: alpha/beta hydrolase [Acidimicrobiales bacterium]|nr:alpha/beta hydrolase [Acidimicrobiales bacterium]
MRIDVGDGVRVFVDVDGPEYEVVGDRMQRRPTVVLLHGGPGMDHSPFKSELRMLTDMAQCVYIDHRANGRSDDGPPERRNLDQWGDDVRTVCDVLGIEKPIVLGQSFGGMVAMAYMTRHPDHPAGVILSSTSARKNRERNIAVFERLGGQAAVDAANAFYDDPGDETLGPFMRDAMSTYNRHFSDPDGASRTVYRLGTLYDFFRGEYHEMDFLPALGSVTCPTLVLGGEDDPTTPIEDQEEIVAALPPDLVEFHRFADCGHGAYRDQPDTAIPIIRSFVEKCFHESREGNA